MAKSPRSISRRISWISSPWMVPVAAYDLEAVVLGRIVAARDHDRAVAFKWNTE